MIKNKKVFVNVRAVSFSDLSHIKEESFKNVGVGNIILQEKEIASENIMPMYLGDEENEPIV